MNTWRSLSAWSLAVVAAVGASPAVAKDRDDVLRWRHTYGEALLEARLRNVPVVVSRHKDT